MTAAATPGGAFAADPTASINYPTFADTSKLSLSGTASVIGAPAKHHPRVLQLTNAGFRQAGSAWSTEKVDLTRSFDSTFKVYLHHGKPGADGIAFLIQGVGPGALGGWGGGLGYRGIKPSVAVEFDTFQNSTDPSSNHLAVVLGGNPDYQTLDAEAGLPLFGKPFVARVVYDAGAMSLKTYVKALSAGAVEHLMLDHHIDLAAAMGMNSAWVGFTGATGSDTSKQDIYSWMVTASDA